MAGFKSQIRDGEVVIGPHNWQRFVNPEVDGEKKSTGLIERNYNTCPLGYLACAPAWSVDMPLIDRSEWPDRIRDMEAQKSRVSDMMLAANVPCLDQDGVGYCWAHSSTAAVMALRAIMNAPTVPLSAFAVAATIKKGADQGGWGAQSLQFITDRGVPSQAVWPQGDRNYKKYDTPETWASAALHKVTEGWVDMQSALYDRKLSFDQEITCYLCRIPVVKDENWWGHSIMGADAINGTSLYGSFRADSGKLMKREEFEYVWGVNDPVTAGFGVRIRNSWGTKWGDNGFGVLSGSKAVSDGATAPRVTTPSPG